MILPPEYLTATQAVWVLSGVLWLGLTAAAWINCCNLNAAIAMLQLHPLSCTFTSLA